jgi:hypothetical protein
LPSEGRGHRFESCRARQLRYIFSNAPDTISLSAIARLASTTSSWSETGDDHRGPIAEDLKYEAWARLADPERYRLVQTAAYAADVLRLWERP